MRYLQEKNRDGYGEFHISISEERQTLCKIMMHKTWREAKSRAEYDLLAKERITDNKFCKICYIKSVVEIGKDKGIKIKTIRI